MHVLESLVSACTCIHGLSTIVASWFWECSGEPHTSWRDLPFEPRDEMQALRLLNSSACQPTTKEIADLIHTYIQIYIYCMYTYNIYIHINVCVHMYMSIYLYIFVYICHVQCIFPEATSWQYAYSMPQQKKVCAPSNLSPAKGLLTSKSIDWELKRTLECWELLNILDLENFQTRYCHYTCYYNFLWWEILRRNQKAWLFGMAGNQRLILQWLSYYHPNILGMGRL